MQLGKMFSGSSSSVSKFFSRRRSGTLLVIVLEEFSVRGVLVRKKSKGTLEVQRYLEVTFEQAIDSAKLRIAHLLKKWGEVPASKILVVCDDFISTSAELPKPKVKRFSREKEGDILKKLARSEIAPFLDYPASQAMVSVFVPPKPKGEFDDYGIDEEENVQAMIFAMPKRHYESIKQVCESLKVKLVGVLPEEIFAFSHCTADANTIESLLDDDDIKPRILVNWRAFDAVVSLLVNNSPVSFQHQSFDGDQSAMEATLTLVEGITLDYADELHGAPQIILGGEGAEQEFQEIVREIAPQTRVQRWDIGMDLPHVQCLGPLPARYMTATTAAFQAMRKGGSSLLVHDHVPFITKLVKHPLALPIIILCIFLSALGLDCAYLKYNVESMKTKIAGLTEQKKELDAEVKKGQDANKKYADTKNDIKAMEGKIKLIDTELFEKQYGIQAVLAGIIDATPASIQIQGLRQVSDYVWFLDGVGQRYDIISWYVVELKNLPMVRQCRLEKSNQVNVGSSQNARGRNTANNTTPSQQYTFTLQIRVVED